MVTLDCENTVGAWVAILRKLNVIIGAGDTQCGDIDFGSTAALNRQT